MPSEPSFRDAITRDRHQSTSDLGFARRRAVILVMLRLWPLRSRRSAGRPTLVGKSAAETRIRSETGRARTRANRGVGPACDDEWPCRTDDRRDVLDEKTSVPNGVGDGRRNPFVAEPRGRNAEGQ